MQDRRLPDHKDPEIIFALFDLQPLSFSPDFSTSNLAKKESVKPRKKKPKALSKSIKKL